MLTGDDRAKDGKLPAQQASGLCQIAGFPCLADEGRADSFAIDRHRRQSDHGETETLSQAGEQIEISFPPTSEGPVKPDTDLTQRTRALRQRSNELLGRRGGELKIEGHRQAVRGAQVREKLEFVPGRSQKPRSRFGTKDAQGVRIKSHDNRR